MIADGQTAETCGHEANILKQKYQVQRDPVSGAVPPEAWPPSMPNIRSARPETGSLAGRWTYALPSVNIKTVPHCSEINLKNLW